MVRWSPAGLAGAPTARQEQGVHHDVLVDGADQVGGQRLDHADAQAGDQRARHAAEAAQADDDEGDQRQRFADGGGDVEEQRDQRAGDAGGGGADAPGDRLHAVGADAHQHGGVAVLGHRQQAAAQRGAGQHQVHAEGDDQRQDTGQQARRLDPQAADVEGAADQRVRQRDEVGGERPERGVAQHQRQAERAKDLRQHRAFGDVPDQAEIDDDTQHEQQRRGAGNEEDRAEFEQGEGKERRIHGQHDEVAMGEVDHVHHAPDQRQAGGKQRIDRSHQQAADHHLQQDHAFMPWPGNAVRGQRCLKLAQKALLMDRPCSA